MVPFFIFSRKSRKKNPKKSDQSFYAWYRVPETGAKLPEYRLNIDTLNVRVNGGMRIHITSKAEAYRIAQAALDRNLVFGYKEEESLTMASYVRTFWDYDNSPYVKRKLVEGSSITKMQCKKMASTFENHCKAFIPDNLKMNDFKIAIMEQIKATMFDKGLSSSAINQAIECLRSPLKEAYRQELITNDVGNRIINVKRTDKERGILTPEESAKVILHLKNSIPIDSYERYRYLVPAIMYYSGMRNNEVTTLTRSCVEMAEGDTCYLLVKHSFNKVDGLKATKNGKERRTTIPKELAKEILDYADRFNPNGFIFFAPLDTTKPIGDDLVRDSFYDALKDIGISTDERKKRNLTLYSLRHGFNTAMINSGLSEVEIQTVTGHSNMAMTQHYNHETKDRLNKQAEARERVLPYLQ